MDKVGKSFEEKYRRLELELELQKKMIRVANDYPEHILNEVLLCGAIAVLKTRDDQVQKIKLLKRIAISSGLGFLLSNGVSSELIN